MGASTVLKPSSKVRSYQDLRVWQLGMDLVVVAHSLAKSLPSFERYGLASQIRRASVSIPANIAEGHGRDHLGDYLRMLSIAKGSLTELETELMIAVRLGYTSSETILPVLKQTAELGRMLTGLSRSLQRRRQSLATST